jgi:hypothetical protein
VQPRKSGRRRATATSRAENRFGRVRSIQDTFLDHHDRTSVFASWWTFLGWLEDEFDGSGQHVAVVRQHLGGAHQHGNVRVVSTGVHDRHVLTVIFAARFRGKRHAGVFQHGQAIHIGPQCNHRSRLAADQGADHTGVCDTGLDLVQPEISQVICNFCRSFELTIREFRVLVNVAPPLDDFRLYRRERVIQS